MARVAVVAVGTELVLGDLVDTNSAWVLAACVAAGHVPVGQRSVGDDEAAIAAAVRAAALGADVVVVTGGLGPTSDDLTAAALTRLGTPTALANDYGSADGLRLSLGAGAAEVFALPGVPREMRGMLATTVLPALVGRAGRPLRTRTLRVVGLGESAVAALVEPVPRPASVALAYLAGAGEVQVRLTTGGAGPADPGRPVHAADGYEAALRRALGEDLYGADDDSLASVVRGLLLARGQTVSAAESLTGGALTAAMVAVPGASDVLLAGVTAYATVQKSALLGVPTPLVAEHGVVSEPVGLAMAQGARSRTGADWAVATTGVAGPGASDGRPAGTVVVAVAGPGVAQARTLALHGDREQVRARAVVAGWDLLRRLLLVEQAGAGQG